MRSIFTFFIVFLLSASHAQNWQWAKNAGGVFSDKASDIDVDENGNSYISGYYNVGQPASVTVNFGTITPQTDWGKEGFIAKVDKYGNYQWVTSAIGGYDERVLGIHVDKKHGFVYATGTQWKWGATFPTFTVGSCIDNSNYGSHDQIFVSKLDLNGNCQWLIAAGGDGDDHGFDLATDKSGNIYLTGFVSDNTYSLAPAVFGTFSVTIPPGDSLAFVAKISPAGVFQWVRTFGGTDGERDNRIAVDSSNNVYVAGGFFGTKVFGTSTLTAINNGLDVFVVKYDQNGNFVWVKQAGGGLDDRANGIAIDPSQKIYITGEFRDFAVFGTDTTNNNGGPNGRDIFVAKLSASGVWQWVKKAGSDEGGERGNSICVNNKGNIFVTGQFADTAKFGATISIITTTVVDVFVAAIDSMGKWRWAIKGGGMYEDRGNGIACDDSCYLYTAGYFDTNAQFGATNLVGYGGKDIFVSKLYSNCFEYITGIEDGQIQRFDEYKMFPNPTKDVLNIVFNSDENSFQEVSVDLVDMLGRRLKEIKTNEQSTQISLADLNPGVYNVIISSKDMKRVHKVIKE